MFTGYEVAAPHIFNSLSEIDMRGRTVGERAQGYVDVANECQCPAQLSNIHQAAYAWMGIRLIEA